MENTLWLYDTLIQVLSQHRQWLDVRHRKTLAWMMVGLIESGLIGLTQWAPYVHGRAVYAQSSVPRFDTPVGECADRRALSQGWILLTRLRLCGEPDPEPAIASNSQYVRDPGHTFKVTFVNYAKT